MHKDLRKIMKALVAQGFEVSFTSRGHMLVVKGDDFVTVFAGTPSDGRSWKNSIAACKRFGFIWPPKR